MAGKKISQLTALGTTFAATDLFEISKDDGGGTYVSRKITGAELSSSISASIAIGDTITSATAGSVLFAGAAGVLAQDNANFFWDDTNNRLGIGTASPSFALHVLDASANLDTKIESNGGHSRFIIDSTGADDSILQFNEANARRWSIYTDGTDDSFKITRSDVPTASPTSDAIAIDSTDNVSIPNGTLTINDYTFPAADGGANEILQTDGAGNLSFAAAGGGSPWTTSGSDIYYNTGKVGIGLTTGFTANLHVKGQGNTDSTVNLLIQNSDGDQIMRIADSGENVFIGLNAGDSATAASGINNVCIGKNAGTDITTHDNNVLIGYAAGTNVTSNSSIMIGYRAGESVVTGTGNIFMGYDSGKEQTESGSTAIGYESARNINGRENTVLGYQALKGNGSSLAAWRNVAIGYKAMTVITTGDNNIAVGLNAGDSITTGSNNTFIGDSADGAATGDNQIACGNGAVASGSNVGIWGNASVATNNITVDWTVTSDERIKENIEDASLGLDFINALKPKTYTKKHPADWDEAILEPRFKQGGSEYDEEKGEPIKGEFDTDKVHNGLIAQDLKAAMDSLGVDFSGWNEDSNGKQGIQYAALVMPLIKAVQELSAKVKELENK